MLKVGLTGGIGSGKTLVARLFEILGIPVYYADTRTKELMNSNETLLTAISKHFGKESYQDNQLNRKYLASVVFNDKKKLELLNKLTHPITIGDAEEWMNLQNTPYALKEAALLFESGANEKLDYLIGVYAPQHLRVKRVMDRDGISAEEVMKRISRQLDEEEKMKRCDFVITNNEQKLVIPQVIELDGKLREMASL